MAATRYDHLIVGGGMVADAAAHGIRELDDTGTIGILSADVDAPYARPALSKKLWTDPSFTWDDVPLHTAEETGADVRLRTLVTSVVPEPVEGRNGYVVTEAGDEVSYGTLLLATGGHPIPLPLADPGERAQTFRTAADYRRLRALADGSTASGTATRIAVVGGGYIGSELAAALSQHGVDTVLVHSTDVLLDDVLPAELAAHVEQTFRDHGVELVGGSKVASGSVGDDGVVLRLDDGREVRADDVVSGLGIEPASSLAEGAEIAVDDGIVVDEQLRTSAAYVFAAGDVASYPDRILGRRRVEHVDQANAMGRAAGRNMAGAGEPYTHTPYYYSVLFGQRYEAVGTLDASLDTIEDWTERFVKGVVYYLDGDRIAGVLLWGFEGEPGRDAARAVLRDQPPRDQLVGRIR